ncbi:hypothetical protein SELMODRAFT_439663 [Selaginella moellendorffii]|uniref:Nuclear pore complex protein Nup205 n=1 Tax=Selaginella moellendorffii TaxID=88036 RepID=D8R4U6_SELML|nr:hypothetical protein SELMODRAFT_439663 [Selaginella moellendorffii]
MVSYRRLQSTVEVVLAGSPSPQQRTELFHMLHLCRPEFESFLLYPEPKAADRTEVLSKEVKLPDAPPTVLDDQDVQIALKLSDDYHLNEIDCVSLLVAAHQEVKNDLKFVQWNLLGREPLEGLRLSAGLWFTERRALINSLQLILRAVVLDEELDPDLVVDLRQYIESLIDAGLRKRLVTLIKELGREDPSGLGGPGVEPYVMDARGALVLRHDVALRERLSICQCLVFSCLIVRINSQEAKDIYGLVKDCSGDPFSSQSVVKLQIAYTVMFTLAISLISDALGGGHEMGSVLSPDAVFRREFHNQVMEVGLESTTKGFTDVIRLVWGVFLMSNVDTSGISINESQSDITNARACLDHACEQNVFKFLVEKILKAAAFENDDPDLVFMYNAYLHKLFIIFLSNPIGREKIKDLKNVAMFSDPYPTEEPMEDDLITRRQAMQTQADPFISLLELISEVYQREPALVSDNEVLWNFIRFISEDHSSYLTLVAFLKMLVGLACSEEGARQVYQMLQNKTFRTVSWQTLFNSLNVYEEHFRHCIQTSGSLLPPFQEGDAKALDAYLQVLKKVLEAGSEVERALWFPDIEPLFKLLPFENVPPYLKGSLRNAISAFVPLSPVIRDRVWSLLDAYDLPLSAATTLGGANVQQVYDMTFELNEVEARQEEYPSTISYLNLLNVLMANDPDKSHKGQKFAGIFKFVRDQVFGPYAQRAYADPTYKWQMVVASLRHFQMMLTLYDVSEGDLQNSLEGSEQSFGGAKLYLPPIEIMKDLMGGKSIFRSLMSIVMLGADFVLEERISKNYGPSLEEAVQLCLELLVIAFQKDIFYADHWRPIYQTIDAILSHDSRQIITLIQYIHYESLSTIQHLSIKIMDVFRCDCFTPSNCAKRVLLDSSRLPHIVSLIVDANAATNLVEDYAACLEARSHELQTSDCVKEDSGSLILRLLLSNLNRPSPNLAHLLLTFDIDQPVERTILQPKRLVYELCVDEFTSGPMLDLMRTEKYDFFSCHLDSACEPLPKRETNHSLRISSLQQRAWLFKLLALDLHVSDMDVLSHRRSCRRLVGKLFMDESVDPLPVTNAVPALLTNYGLQKMKVLELLDILQFSLAEPPTEIPQCIEDFKEDLKVEEILNNPALVDDGGIYTLSERGDRIIDLTAFRDKLWQACKRLEMQYNILANERRQVAVRDAVQQLLRWAWKRNKFLEEQAAQLHMLVGWTQLVEVTFSRRFEFLGNRIQVIYDTLEAVLDASCSSDCSLSMAYVLSQVVLTSMAKLQDHGIFAPGEEDYNDDATYGDVLTTVRLPNTACQTILSKLLTGVLRPESSEALRRRQFASLLSYFHYCQGMVNSELSVSMMRGLLMEGQDGVEDTEFEKLEGDQAELAQMNFNMLRQEATALLDLVVKDALHGSETGKAIAFYVLEALVAVDRNQLFFGHLQSRGLLNSCFTDISTNSYQALILPSRDMIRRLYTLEAELALLLRVCFHNKKRGAQALFAMGAIQHLSSCKAIDVQLTDDARKEHMGIGLPSQHDRQHQIVIPVLRLILCFTTLIDTGRKDRDEVALEVLEFVKLHHGLFDRILRDDGTKMYLADLEELHLATAILSKVWPFEGSEDFGFKQGLFNLAYIYFAQDNQSRSGFIQFSKSQRQNMGVPAEDSKKIELLVTRLRGNLVSYIHTLVSKQGMRLNISGTDSSEVVMRHYTLGLQRQPSLKLVSSLLEQAALDLESSAEEKMLIVAKLPDINELTRQEVDDIAKSKQGSEMESMRKRRYLAMVEMCTDASIRDTQIACLVLVVEQALEILYLHVEAIQEAAQGAQDSTQAHKGELDALGQKLLPTFEKLESIKEDKVGRGVKHIHRLIYSLKSQTRRYFD